MTEVDGGGDLFIAGAFVEAVGGKNGRHRDTGLKNMDVGVDDEHGNHLINCSIPGKFNELKSKCQELFHNYAGKMVIYTVDGGGGLW
jgi:hypothetical protein